VEGNKPIVIAAKFTTKEAAKRAYAGLQQYIHRHKGQGYDTSGHNTWLSTMGFLVIFINHSKPYEEQKQNAIKSIYREHGGKLTQIPEEVLIALIASYGMGLPNERKEGNWREWHSGL
jgi:hypothetical protein